MIIYDKENDGNNINKKKYNDNSDNNVNKIIMITMMIKW